MKAEKDKSSNSSKDIFLLGHELEMYFLLSVEEEDILPSLNNFLTKKYEKKDLKFLKKCTLVDDKTLGELYYENGRTYFSKELITPPIPAKLSKEILKDIFAWMGEIKARTSSDCGLHLNYSFIDNREVDYHQLLALVPQKKLLTQFGRENNLHTQSTKQLITQEKFFLKEEIRFHVSDVLDKSTYLDQAFKKFLKNENIHISKFKEFVDTQKLAKFLNKEIEKVALNKINDLLSEKKKSHSIVQKTNKKKQKYYEFRITGNAGYELQYDTIISTSDNFEKALLKSSKINKNNKLFKQ